MARYIDADELEKRADEKFSYITSPILDNVKVREFYQLLDDSPTANVVEREKIDKTIDEIETVIKQWEHRVEIREKNSCYHDETNNYIALSNQLIGMEKILEILKRNIGEVEKEK